MPKFLSRGQSYRAVIGDTIVLPCLTQDLGEKRKMEKGKIVRSIGQEHVLPNINGMKHMLQQIEACT
jgi:hypothetical protein